MRIDKQYFNEFISEFNLFGPRLVYTIFIFEALLISYLHQYYNNLQIVTDTANNNLMNRLIIITICLIIFFPRTLIFLKNSPRKIFFIFPLLILYILTGATLESLEEIINYKFSGQASEIVTEKNVSFYKDSNVMEFYLEGNESHFFSVELPNNDKYTNSDNNINVEYKVYTGYFGKKWLKKNEIKINISNKEIK